MSPKPLAESDRSWPEDSEHENGNYLCHCLECRNDFIGLKRRVICRICARAEADRWNGLTEEQQVQERERTRRELDHWMKAKGLR